MHILSWELVGVFFFWGGGGGGACWCTYTHCLLSVSTEEAGRTSISNFMDINKILLISHDEFMPSRLMDHYWATFSQSEDWQM